MHMPVNKRDRILDAAAQLIVENGLQCSMAAIAVRAGVATGSLYNYFPSKKALVLGVYARVGEEMAAAMMVEHAENVDHGARIRRYISDYIAFILEGPERARIFEYLDNSPELSRADIAATFSGFLDYTRRLFEDGQKTGQVREGQSFLLASFVRGAIRHAIKRRRLDPRPIATEEVDQIADMCWQAIARR